MLLPQVLNLLQNSKSFFQGYYLLRKHHPGERLTGHFCLFSADGYLCQFFLPHTCHGVQSFPGSSCLRRGDHGAEASFDVTWGLGTHHGLSNPQERGYWTKAQEAPCLPHNVLKEPLNGRGFILHGEDVRHWSPLVWGWRQFRDDKGCCTTWN